MNKGYVKIAKLNNENRYYENQKKIFFEKNQYFKTFKDITHERKQEIEEKVQFWLSHNQEMSHHQKLYSLYNLLNQKVLLDLETSDEALLFLILAFDPSLKLLQISYESSEKQEIKKRFEEEFQTFYDSRLLTIETYYNKRFPTVVDEFDKKI